MSDTPEVQTDQEAKEAADAPTPVEGVLVQVQYGEDGSVQVNIQQLGSVRVTEVQTILQQALTQWRTRLGLTE